MRTIEEIITDKIEDIAGYIYLSPEAKAAICEIVKERLVGLATNQITKVELEDVGAKYDDRD